MIKPNSFCKKKENRKRKKEWWKKYIQWYPSDSNRFGIPAQFKQNTRNVCCFDDARQSAQFETRKLEKKSWCSLWKDGEFLRGKFVWPPPFANIQSIPSKNFKPCPYVHVQNKNCLTESTWSYLAKNDTKICADPHTIPSQPKQQSSFHSCVRCPVSTRVVTPVSKASP